MFPHAPIKKDAKIASVTAVYAAGREVFKLKSQLNGEIAGTGAIFADFIGIASSIWSLCYGWLMQDAPFNPV